MTIETRNEWHGPAILDYSPAETFAERYSRFIQAAQSLRTFLRTVDNPDERTLAISSFANFADVFQCELTARADELWRETAKRVGYATTNIQQALQRFAYEQGDIDSDLDTVMNLSGGLYKAISACPTARKRRGHWEAYRGGPSREVLETIRKSIGEVGYDNYLYGIHQSLDSGWVWDKPQKINELGKKLIEVVRAANGEPVTQGKIFRKIPKDNDHIKRELSKLVRREFLTNNYRREGYLLGPSSDA